MKKYLFILLSVLSLSASAQDTTLTTVTLTAGTWASIHSIIRNDEHHEDLALQIVTSIGQETIGISVPITVNANKLVDLWRTLNGMPYRRVATFIGSTRTGFTTTTYPTFNTWVTTYDNDVSADITLRRNLSLAIIRRY